MTKGEAMMFIGLTLFGLFVFCLTLYKQSRPKKTEQEIEKDLYKWN